MNINLNQIIAYTISFIITGIGAIALREIKKIREDKNSFYNKEKEFLEQKLGESNYNVAKGIVVDAVYRAEQLGKELAWDGLTKHSKVLEWVKGKTCLSDSDIYDIIKSTVGYINAAKDGTTKTVDNTPVVPQTINPTNITNNNIK